MSASHRQTVKAGSGYRTIFTNRGMPSETSLQLSSVDDSRDQQIAQQQPQQQQQQQHSLSAAPGLAASRLGHKHLIPPSSGIARAVMMGNANSNHTVHQHPRQVPSQPQPMSNLSALLEGRSPTSAVNAADTAGESQPCAACEQEEAEQQQQQQAHQDQIANTLSSSSASSKHGEADLASGPPPTTSSQPPLALGSSAPTIITRQRRHSATIKGTPPTSLMLTTAAAAAAAVVAGNNTSKASSTGRNCSCNNTPRR